MKPVLFLLCSLLIMRSDTNNPGVLHDVRLLSKDLRTILPRGDKTPVPTIHTGPDASPVSRPAQFMMQSNNRRVFVRRTPTSWLDASPVSGNTMVEPGSVESYTVSWEAWDNTYEGYANVNWEVSGGSVVSSDKHTVTIQWNVVTGYADMSGNIYVSEDLGGQSGGLGVTVLNNTEGTSDFCSGILGPPVIAIDFGSGSNPGPALSAGTTTYQYNANCAISPGQYTVVNNSVGCRSHWHNIPQDHTPNDVNGYFLMVDANRNRDEFFRASVNGLNASFRYEFSAWVANLSDIGDNPQLRFEVYDPSGNLLGTSGTNTIAYDASFQWHKIGFMFNLPPGTSAVEVKIVNTSVNRNGTGNDVVLDDISFAPCYTPIIASFSSSSIVDRAHTCNNGTVTLYASWPSTIPFQNPAFQWQRSADGTGVWTDIPGATGMSYTQTENTPNVWIYRVISYESSNPSQSVMSNIINYYVQQLVVDARTTNVFSCAGEPTHEQLGAFFHMQYADPSDHLTYSFAWSPSPYISGNLNASVIYVDLPGRPAPDPAGPAVAPVNYTLSLTVTNANYGCSATNTQTVAQFSPRKIYVPSAFTPVPHGSGQQGPNNLFRPINAQDYPGATFGVYNRYGQRIFYSEGPTLLDYSWDGSFQSIDQPSTTYVWLVTLPACYTNIYSGSNGDGYPYGTVVLIR